MNEASQMEREDLQRRPLLRATRKPYPAYRDSGVGWIGRVPEHWDVSRTKFVARLESGHTPSRQHPEYWVDCTIPWFTLADVWQIRDGKTEYVHETAEKVSELGIANSSARLLPKGTVIVSRTASVGFSAILGVDGATTQDFVNWVCGPRIRPEYLLYVFRSMRQEFRRLTMGSTHQTIYMPDVGQFSTPVPPLDEQDAIVRFIRQETSRIDALLEKKRRLTELLNEQRAAMIVHAVSRGLRGTVPMRNSCAAWLGEVPAHWDVLRLKFVAKMESGHTPSRSVPEYWENCTIPWVSLNDTKRLMECDFLDETTHCISELGMQNSSAHILPAEAVVFSRDATIGLCAITASPMAVSQHFIAWICGPRLLPEYLLHVLRSMRQELDRLTMGATIKTIGMPDVRSLVVPVPPIDEQRSILSHIGTEATRIDGLVAKIDCHIGLLEEHRAALINAAVTGQIDVRAEVPA